MDLRNFALVVGLAATFVGCKTSEDTVVGKPPSEEALDTNQPRALSSGEQNPEPTRYPDPGLLLETWPFPEERRTFALTWVGGNRGVPMHARPDPNSEILGEVVWEKNEKIRWQGTVVAVYQPKLLRAKEEWFVEGPPYSTGYLTDTEFVSTTVRKGQSIEVWMYAGAGQCYLAADGKFFTGQCPPKDAFYGNFTGKVPAQWYQPEKKVWWIQIAVGPTIGWFPVDDRVAVDFIDE